MQVDPKKCCPSCFDHPWLVASVRKGSTETGTCDYCGTADVPLLDVAELSEAFHNMLTIYEELQAGETMGDFEDPLNVGETLIEMIQEDFGVFSDLVFDCGEAGRLLEDVANADWDDDGGESMIHATELRTRRKSIWHTTEAERWDKFCEEVRQSPATEPNFNEILGEDLGRRKSTLNAGTIVYRARLGWHGEENDGNKIPWRGGDIGAPPPEKSREGRANAKGQIVLYVAEGEKTAIAEIRPARGLIVSVAQFRTSRDLRLLDLARAFEAPNPFTDNPLRYWIEFQELLQAFGWALSKPLERDDDLADYLPSQKLADFVRASSFDGMRYPSAMHAQGANIVLFDPASCEFVDAKLVRVSNIEIEYEPA